MFKNEQEWGEAIKSVVASSKENISIIKLMDIEAESWDYEEKSVTFLFRSKEFFSNQFSKTAGSVLAALMEIGCGTLANCVAGGITAVTTDMQISFIREVKAGEDLRLKAYLVKDGRALIRTRGEIFDPATGKLAVSAAVSSFRL